MSNNLRIPRDFRPLAAQAQRAGWTISPLGNEHLISQLRPERGP
jgi:hypothetical protein